MSETLVKRQAAEKSAGWGQGDEKRYMRYIHTEEESVTYTCRKACKKDEKQRKGTNGHLKTQSKG